jgi:hypothetical protein
MPYCGEPACGVVDCGGVDGSLGGGGAEFGVLEPGLTLPAPEVLPLPLVCGGAAVEPAAPLVSLGAAELGDVELDGALVVAETLAVPPVVAPDHQSLDARLLGEAARYWSSIAYGIGCGGLAHFEAEADDVPLW